MREPKDFNLLIVDDEDELRELLASHFEMEGYNLFTAGGGYEALEIVKNNNIDFIISDVRMPKGDGIMLLGKVHEMKSDAPIIVLVTGFAKLTREEALEKGALDLLEKPINLEQIEKYIKEAL